MPVSGDRAPAESARRRQRDDARARGSLNLAPRRGSRLQPSRRRYPRPASFGATKQACFPASDLAPCHALPAAGIGSAATPRGDQRKRARSCFGNDPSAGSPTETLLRLLLPLDDQVRSSSRHAGTAVAHQARTNPRISLNHPIGSSDGRCVQRAGT